jgi:DsbE subfamily thiol:disulfide oxidoreductase
VIALIALIAGCRPPQTDGGWGSAGAGGSESGDNVAPAVGRPAPTFRLPTVDGAAIALDDLRGRPVVLNFWATWCGPCKAEMPELQALADRRAGGVSVVGVDMQESAEEVAPFLASLGITFPIVLDRDGTVTRRYLVRGVPTTFLIDGEGIVRDINVGPVTRDLLEEKLAGLG